MFRNNRLMSLVALLLLGLALSARAHGPAQDGLDPMVLAGRQVYVWKPRPGTKAPLILFSHGFHGSARQSVSLMVALAHAGYLVVAPNHQDAMARGLQPKLQPDVRFQDVDSWTDETYQDRGQDLVAVARALAADPSLSPLYDHSRIGLVGHSLGGYTVLGLAGAWPAWTHTGLHLRAVVALSPYVNPFLLQATLPGLQVPVMYQGGTRDFGITPFVKKPRGAYDESPRPKYFVEFNGAGHLSWTDLRTDQAPMMEAYTIAFLNHYVAGRAADPILTHRMDAVATLRYASDLGTSP